MPFACCQTNCATSFVSSGRSSLHISRKQAKSPSTLPAWSLTLLARPSDGRQAAILLVSIGSSDVREPVFGFHIVFVLDVATAHSICTSEPIGWLPSLFCEVLQPRCLPLSQLLIGLSGRPMWANIGSGTRDGRESISGEAGDVFAELKGVRLPPRAVPCGVKALVVWGTCCPKPHFGIAPK